MLAEWNAAMTSVGEVALCPRLFSRSSVLHQFPAVCGEQQVHRVVLQLVFVLQVGTYQLSDGRAPVCPKKPNRGLLHTQTGTLYLHLQADRWDGYANVSYRGISSSLLCGRSVAAPERACCTAWFSRPCLPPPAR